MHAPRTRTGLFAASLLTFAGVVFLAGRWGDESGFAQTPPPRDDQAVTVPQNLAGFLIHLGVGDKEAAAFTGDVTVSPGKLVSLELVQGGAKSNVKSEKFNVTSQPGKKKEKKKLGIIPPILRLTVDAPAQAKITVATDQGNFAFALADVPAAGTSQFLKGRATVEREEGALRLTGDQFEDDYPALARAPDGNVWLAYTVYRPSKPYITERVLAGNFEELVPTGNGDQIRLKLFNGTIWSEPVDVTDAGLDIWRPTVAVDTKGVVHVAWAQQVNGEWGVYHRAFTKLRGSKISKLSGPKGNHIHVVAAADANGDVWFAWQAWLEKSFQIQLQSLKQATGRLPGQPTLPKTITTAQANHWSPAIACDSRGGVFVAYDTYDKENYDVRLYAMTGGIARTYDVAKSARFEARPSLAVDSEDRVWIAYEEGDEQWGKDYATNMFRKIGLDENPGMGLYNNRTLRVKCFSFGKLQQPAGALDKAFGKLNSNKSYPRLTVDSQDGVWLSFRHHPKALGGGEVWTSFVTRYDGAEWSPVRRLAQSENLLDNRPALARAKSGIVTVFSGDKRTKNLDRKQNDLYAIVLHGSGAKQPLKTMDDEPPPAPTLKPVHKDETAQVARIRGTKFNHDGKALGLYRGEFHRHTEYTAHRDQDGSLEDSFRYALDAGRLDWMGNGDHDNGHHDEYCWWQIQKTTDLFHNPPHFVAVQTYERSNVFPNGHRNVMMPKRGIRPLPRGNLKGTEEGGTPDTKMLYRFLKQFGGICSSHTSGTNMGTDWRDNDPVAEPVVEIYQGHRHNYEHFGAPRSPTKETNIGGYEPAGFVWNALTKGYKLGFQASSDHVSTHMSYGVVLTNDFSRAGIIEAFKRRHSYAATDNIILDVRCGEHLMGDIFETNKPLIFKVSVQGTGPIAKVSIIRSGKYVHVEKPMQAEVNVTWEDREPEPGKSHYYYVRVEQEDGNLAWASPMWITWKGK